MRLSARVAAVSLISACVLAAGATANAADVGGSSTGNGGNAPGPSVAASTAGAKVTSVPAFDHDLPAGSVSFGPGAAAPSGAKTATASLSYAAGSWICSVFASNPYRSSHSGRASVDGEGWQSCTGATQGYVTALKVTIQRYAGLGVWNNKYSWSSGYTSSAWLERVIWYFCGGTGTETYRIVTDGWMYTYHSAVQSSTYLRTTC